MGIKCLGAITIEPPGFTDLVLVLRDVNDEEEQKRIISTMGYFKLGKKRYFPLTHEGEVDQSENRCEITLERSKEKPQQVGEVAKLRTASTALSISSEMMNRLWLYDGKLYQSTRNDYSQEQVHLLILDFLDKEEKKFKELKEKFKRK